MNHISERRKLLDGLLNKMQELLEENVLVVAEIQRQRYNTERGRDESLDPVR